MDCSPPGFSVHGILQARILEWVAISFSRGSFRPRDRTQVSCIAGRRFNLWANIAKEINKYFKKNDHPEVRTIHIEELGISRHDKVIRPKPMC